MGTQNEEKLTEMLQHVIEIENTTALCYRRLSLLIKNGNVREQFYAFAQIAEKNKEIAGEHLPDLVTTDFVHKETCRVCRIDPESFSLLGALNFGLEVTGMAVQMYRQILDLNISSTYWEFSRLLEEKEMQRIFLKKEKKFTEERQDEPNLIDSYCIGQIISNLWK